MILVRRHPVQLRHPVLESAALRGQPQGDPGRRQPGGARPQPSGRRADRGRRARRARAARSPRPRARSTRAVQGLGRASSACSTPRSRLEMDKAMSNDQAPIHPLRLCKEVKRLHPARRDPRRRRSGDPELRPPVHPDVRARPSVELRAVRLHGRGPAVRHRREGGQARRAGGGAPRRRLVRHQRQRRSTPPSGTRSPCWWSSATTAAGPPIPTENKPGRNLGYTRWDKVAMAVGAHGEFVEKPDDIRPALERAWASGKPAVVNVVTRLQGARHDRALLGVPDVGGRDNHGQGARRHPRSRSHAIRGWAELHGAARLARRRGHQDRAAGRGARAARALASGRTWIRTSSSCSTRTRRASPSTSSHERGRQMFARPGEAADVVIENLGPGAMERLGFGYEALAADQPARHLGLGQGVRQRRALRRTTRASSGSPRRWAA